MKVANWPSLIWNAPGRLWAGMMAAGSLSLWLTAGAGMAWTLVTVGLVFLFRDSLAASDQFWIIISGQGLVFVALCAMAGQEISLGISRQGLNLNVGRDEDAKQVAEITTRTTVTTAGADDGELPPDQRVIR